MGLAIFTILPFLYIVPAGLPEVELAIRLQRAILQVFTSRARLLWECQIPQPTSTPCFSPTLVILRRTSWLCAESDNGKCECGVQSVPGSSSCSKPKLSNKAKISRDGLAKILDPWVQILSVATSNWKLIVKCLKNIV